MLKDYGPNSKEGRIINWLNQQKKGYRFTASEISKPLNISPCFIGNILKSIPGVKDSGEKAASCNKVPNQRRPARSSVIWEVC